jgi:hypothetical protein
MGSPNTFRGAEIGWNQDIDGGDRHIVLILGDLWGYSMSKASPTIVNYHSPPETNPMMLFLLGDLPLAGVTV